MKPKSNFVILSLCYWILRRLLELAVLALRSEDAKEVEIVVLRHQLHALNRQVKRPDVKLHDRALLAAVSRVLPRKLWAALFVRPETVLRWHRALVARRWTYPCRQAARPRRLSSADWSFDSQRRTRPGATGASRASSSCSVSPSPRAPVVDPARVRHRPRAQEGRTVVEGVFTGPG